MKEKKSAVITFRTEEWVKQKLEQYAKEEKRSIAQIAEQACRNIAIDPRPNEIIVKTEELYSKVKEYKEDGTKAIILHFDMVPNDEERVIYKAIHFEGLESGGRIRWQDMDEIEEMTTEEILEIP